VGKRGGRTWVEKKSTGEKENREGKEKGKRTMEHHTKEWGGKTNYNRKKEAAQ